MLENFNVNSNPVSTGKQSLYCGPQMFRPQLINPTRAQLNQFLGSDKKTDEINYNFETTIQGEVVDSVRVVMWGYFTNSKGEEYKGCLDPLWVKNAHMKSKDGTKSCWINPYGRVAWAATPKDVNYNWYSVSSRKAIWGEDALMDFFINLIGINTFYSTTMDSAAVPDFIKKEETYINIDKIFSKDYSELQAVINRFCTTDTDLDTDNVNYMRKITVLTSVTPRVDTGELVQTYFTGKFGRTKKAGNTYTIIDSDVNQILKSANVVAEKGYFKHQGVLVNKLTEYTPDMEVATVATEVAPW